MFLDYNHELAKNKKRLRILETELKAYWDAKAICHGFPPLDPLIVLGYKPLGR